MTDANHAQYREDTLAAERAYKKATTKPSARMQKAVRRMRRLDIARKTVVQLALHEISDQATYDECARACDTALRELEASYAAARAAFRARSGPA